MTAHLSAAAALERHFLETRCKILEIAANLDRIDRGVTDAAAAQDARLARIHEALRVLLAPGPGRTELCQQVFSLPYDPNWKPPR
jgi:hypothetical protein